MSMSARTNIRQNLSREIRAFETNRVRIFYFWMNEKCTFGCTALSRRDRKKWLNALLMNTGVIEYEPLNFLVTSLVI